MTELATNEAWQGVKLAIASCCDEPAWARECLAKFSIDPLGRSLEDVFADCEIRKGNKQGHLRAIARRAEIEFGEIMFFDNEPYNCQEVAELGVMSVYCPNGFTTRVWAEALAAYPSPGKVIRC